jgi:DNA oxidative demethylase
MNLFETQDFIEGFEIHRHYLPIERQLIILEACRKVIKASKLFRPKFYGKAFVSDYALENVNCGTQAWTSTENGFRYAPNDIEGNPLPPIPDEILEVVRELTPSNFQAENCLINFYQDRKIDGRLKLSHLGLHQDKTEKDLTAPIVSISLGQAAIFQIGGLNKSDPVSEVELISGDVVIMAGKSRNAFHGVKHLLPNTCPKDLGIKDESRINITIRQVNPNDFWDNIKQYHQVAKMDDTFFSTDHKEVRQLLNNERNQFQNKFSAETIKNIESKFLDSSKRTYQEHCAKALTPEERLIYANYLRTKGDEKSAISFETYIEPIEKQKKEKRR